jgi:hypothetical protein
VTSAAAEHRDPDKLDLAGVIRGTSTVGRALGATAGEVEQPVEDPLAVDA